MEPIYTAGKATVKQVVTWANNDDIETMLLATKEKIVDVTTKFSEDASIQTANPEDVKNQELAVTAPVVKQPETKLVVTNAKEMADAMYAYYSSFSPSFEIQYKGSTQRIEKIVEEAYDSAIKRDDYVYGHISKHSIRFEYGKKTAKIFGEQSYLMTPEQAAYVEMNAQEIVATIAKNAKTDVEKIKAANDYIGANTAYTEKTKSSPHSAYTVLAEHGGVCQGYALLAHSMLQKLGFETKYIVGYVGQEGPEGRWCTR